MQTQADHASRGPGPGNLLEIAELGHDREHFEDLLRLPGMRVERIVSRGQTTPSDQPYVQNRDEWVLILEGSAELQIAGIGKRTLNKGDHLLIPAGAAHLVTYTEDPTIWLAIHIGEA